jgi:hypothetical protein
LVKSRAVKKPTHPCTTKPLKIHQPKNWKLTGSSGEKSLVTKEAMGMASVKAALLP